MLLCLSNYLPQHIHGSKKYHDQQMDLLGVCLLNHAKIAYLPLPVVSLFAFTPQ